MRPIRVRSRLAPMAGRDPRSATAVAVYRHLPREVFSIRALDGPHRGRVLAHGTQLGLRDARMVVNETARRKIAAGSAKDVHAWITGTLASVTLDDPVRITYRPRDRGVFFVVETVFVDRADLAVDDVDTAVTENRPGGGTSQ